MINANEGQVVSMEITEVLSLEEVIDLRVKLEPVLVQAGEERIDSPERSKSMASIRSNIMIQNGHDQMAIEI